MKTTLIISTYNRPEALSVCLDSVRFQTVMPDEVIVGDDGSTSETKDLIESFKKDFPVPLIHLWQEDKGFRLAMMRNKSVAAQTISETRTLFEGNQSESGAETNRRNL